MELFGTKEIIFFFGLAPNTLKHSTETGYPERATIVLNQRNFATGKDNYFLWIGKFGDTNLLVSS